jgi:hypothetical protein
MVETARYAKEVLVLHSQDTQSGVNFESQKLLEKQKRRAQQMASYNKQCKERFAKKLMSQGGQPQ